MYQFKQYSIPDQILARRSLNNYPYCSNIHNIYSSYTTRALTFKFLTLTFTFQTLTNKHSKSCQLSLLYSLTNSKLYNFLIFLKVNHTDILSKSLFLLNLNPDTLINRFTYIPKQVQITISLVEIKFSLILSKYSVKDQVSIRMATL